MATLERGYEQFQKERKDSVEEHVTVARIADGLLDLKTATAEEKASILEIWEKAVNAVSVDTKVGKKEKNKERRWIRQSKK